MNTCDLLPLPPDTVRHIFARRDTSIRGTYVLREKQLDRLRAAFSDWNLYITLNPTRPSARSRMRPRARDISHLQAILIDIDPIAESAQPMRAATLAAELLHERGIPVDCMVFLDSGRGVQLWLMHPLTPVEDIPDCADRVAALVRWIATRMLLGRYGCVVDTSCSDLARLARLPGSVNQKTGLQTSLMTLPEPTEPWLCSIPFEPPSRAQSSGLGGHYTRGRIFARVTQAARAFLEDGKVEPGRHFACIATVKSLEEIGVPEEIAAKLTHKSAADLCEPPLPPHDVDKMLDQVYGGE